MKREKHVTALYISKPFGSICVVRNSLISLMIVVLVLSFFSICTGLVLGEYENQNRAPGQDPQKLSGLIDSGNYNYVTIADMNNDGYNDIIAGAGGYPGNDPGGLYVYLNNNGNTFTESSNGLPGAGSDYFGSIQVVDIDDDSDLDIIAAYESRWSGGNSNGIGIWLGNGGSGGTLSFSSATSPINSGSFDSVYCADINDDSKLDIVGGSSSGLYAWEGQHSGSTLIWTLARTGLPISGEVTGVTLGDVNGDDRLDIVAGSYNSKGISVYLCSNSGAITWSDGHSGTNLVQSGNSFEMYLTDLNDDKNLDIVAGIRGGVRAYLGNGNSGDKNTWWQDVSTGLPTSSDYYQIAVDDIDKDGKVDIGSNFKVWSNNGEMDDKESYNWEQKDLGISESSSVGLTLTELNNDGYKDIVGCGWGIGVRAYSLYLDNSGPPVEKFYKIKGTVTDQQDKSPLAYATVIIENSEFETTTDSKGNYEFEVKDGSYEISVTFSGYRKATKAVEISGSDMTLDIQLIKIPEKPEPKYMIEGKITDKQTDDPFKDLTIELQPGDNYVKTDDQGNYNYTVLNGSYILKVNVMGYNDKTINIEVSGKDLSVDVQIVKIVEKPEPKFILSGKITDEENGQPIKYLTVVLQPGEHSTQTNEDGFYEFTIINGSYTLKITATGYENETYNIEVSGKEMNKNIVLTLETKPNGNGNGNTDPDGKDDNEKKESGNTFMYLAIPIIIVVIIILLIIIFISKRNKDQ